MNWLFVVAEECYERSELRAARLRERAEIVMLVERWLVMWIVRYEERTRLLLLLDAREV